MIVKGGSDVNFSAPDGSTALLVIPSISGSAEAARLLIKHGANVKMAKKNGSNPVTIAAQNNVSLPLMKVLLDAGVPVNHLRDDGSTPLYMAVQQEASLDLIRMLLMAGADPNLSKHDGWTPLMMAVSNGSYAHAAMLVRAGADAIFPRLRDRVDKADTLTIACRRAGQVVDTEQGEKCVELILQCGGDPKLPHYHTPTPLWVFELMRMPKPTPGVVRLLLQYIPERPLPFPLAHKDSPSPTLLSNSLLMNVPPPRFDVPNVGLFEFCTACRKDAAAVETLHQCGSCRTVAYCNRDCQTNHWTKHKTVCKAIQARRKLFAGDASAAAASTSG